MKMLCIIFIILFFFIPGPADAQSQDTTAREVYKYNHKWEIPATIAGYGLDAFGLDVLGDKPRLDSLTILGLNRNDIWKFDRRAAYQSPNFSESAQLISDIGMNVSLLLPAILAFDDDIRKDWLDVLLIYLETQAVGANLYIWTGPAINNRIRPFVYNPDFDQESKLGSGTRDSFFSGHTLWTASASFFTAKVYADYHPELGNKKFWIYAAALIPPAFVGYHRYRASKHFPTDIFTGFALGAATGVLIPHLHKINAQDNFAFAPFFGSYNGLAFTMNF